MAGPSNFRESNMVAWQLVLFCLMDLKWGHNVHGRWKMLFIRMFACKLRSTPGHIHWYTAVSGYLLFKLFIFLPPSCIMACLYLTDTYTKLHLLVCMDSRKRDLFSLNVRCLVNRKQKKMISFMVLYYSIMRETLYCILMKLPEA